MRIATLVVFILAWALPGFTAVPPQTQKADAIQTQITSPIPFNAPSEQPHSVVVAKVFFEGVSFLVEQLLDLPAQKTVNNPAILQSSYEHNPFYVTLTAKAP